MAIIEKIKGIFVKPKDEGSIKITIPQEQVTETSTARYEAKRTDSGDTIVTVTPKTSTTETASTPSSQTSSSKSRKTFVLKPGETFQETPQGVEVQPVAPTQKAQEIKPVSTSMQTISKDAYQPEQKTISAAKPIPQKSAWWATKETAKNIGTDVKTFFTGRATDNYIGPSGWTEPFSSVEKTVAEEKGEIPLRLRRGTVSRGEDAFFKLENLDVQKDMEREMAIRAVSSKRQGVITEETRVLQERINLGEIAVGEAESIISPKIKQQSALLQEDVKNIYRKNPDIITPQEEIRRTTYTKGFIEAVPDLAVIGTSLAVPAVAPTLTTGYFAGKGIYYGSKKTDFATAFQDISQSVEFEGGKVTAKETDLFKEYKGYQEKAGTSFAIGAIGAISIPGQIGKEITQLRLEEGLAKPTATTIRPMSTGGISRTGFETDTFRTFQKTSYQVTEKGNKIFVTGTGKKTISVLDFNRQGKTISPWVSSTKEFSFGAEAGKAKFTGIKTADFFAFDPSIKKQLASFVVKRGYLSSGENIQKIPTSGILQQSAGDKTLAISGKVRAVKFADGKLSLRFAKENYALVRPNLLKETPKGLGDIGRIGGNGFKSSGGSGKLILEMQTQKQFSGFISQLSPEMTLSQGTKTSIIGIPTSAFKTKTSTVQIEKEISIPSQKFSSIQILSDAPVEIQSQEQLNAISSITSAKSFFKPSQDLAISPIMKEITKAKPKLSKSPATFTGTNIFPGFGRGSFGGGSGFFPFGGKGKMPDLFDFGFSRRGKKERPFQTRYAPTITSIGFGIKSPKVPGLYKRGFGVFSIRPIIGGKRKSGKTARRKKRS